jgi:hypothetical protein
MPDALKETPKENKEIKLEVKKEENKNNNLKDNIKEIPKKEEKRVHRKEIIAMLKRERMANKEEIKDAVEKEKVKLLQMSEISLWLDAYDDIFSDFDPRPYAQRALSDDFLSEAKRASKEKISGQIELKFLVPKNIKNLELENIIKKRLREHFKKHSQVLHNEVKEIRKGGIMLFFLGAPLTMLATYLSTLEKSILVSFFVVLLEPAGWFTTWEGLARILSAKSQKGADIDFYDKMTKCEILFIPY